MRYSSLALGVIATSLLISQPVQANIAEPIPYPDPAPLDQRGEIEFIGYHDFQKYEALEQYNEPAYISELVSAGKLPSVEERLPKEPYVFKTNAMADGIGEYGGVLRMVTGGRPQGWNWMANQSQGWGGINFAVQECLVRTGNMFQVRAEELQPMPNLAHSWDWSEDGMQLTMHLMEGVKWSDGHPFSADDIMFMWEDNVQDPKVTSAITPDTFGENASLEKLDNHTIQWTFSTPYRMQNLHSMAAFNFCPGPSHILKPEHPRYNPEANYNDYANNVLSPERLPWVTLGAWTAVEYKADEILVMRRNPYFWKIDEAGNQLPYLNEVQFKLSTWADRTVQALSGNADISNMENPPVYVESLRQANRPESPSTLSFGPRTIGYMLMPNQAETFGAKSDRELAIRQLNRDDRFRRALSHAIDRGAMGQSMVRGPFTHVYAGGILPESTYFDKDSVVYYPYSPDSAKQLLKEIGLEDTNGDGYIQWTDGKVAGQTVEMVMIYDNERPSDAILADNAIAMMQEVGIRIIPRAYPANQFSRLSDAAEFDLLIGRTDRPHVTPDTQLHSLAPTSNRAFGAHHSSSEHPHNYMPFEEQLIDIVNELEETHDPVKKVALFNEYNRIHTKHNYTIGLTAAPGALIINKRFRNITPGTPILAYQWSDKSITRERLWVPKDQQIAEIFPGMVP